MRRQNSACAGPLEKLETEGLLERHDLMTQGWLTHPEHFRRAPKIQSIDHGHEVLDLADSRISTLHAFFLQWLVE